MHCSVFKIFFLVISFFALCLLHLYARYICNNVFPCSIMLDMSCYTYFKMGTRGCKKWSRSEKGKIFTLDNCSVYKMFFLVISLSQLVCYICTHVTYVPTDFLVPSHWTCHACVMYITHQICVTYVTFCYICNSHSFLQMFAQHCYLCNKRQHPECQQKELWQEVSKFVCDMTTCYIPDWHSYLQLSWSNCFVTHAAEANVWNASQKQLCQKR